jgi:YfiH family protein
MIIIQDQKLNGESGKIQHGFFGRQGGVSKGLYSNLNCGVGSKDAPEAVQENRGRVAEKLGVTPENLVRVWQSHTPDCTVINGPNNPNEDPVVADAMVTDKAGLALGVLTADCGPILFAGEKADGSPVIGAAHAGWGGALRGVLENTVARMQEIGADLDTIRAAVGPCIGPKSYEVSVGFEEPFLERNPEDEHFFREAMKDGHLMFDLPGYIASRLAQAGLKRVTITGDDTFAQPELFFSYRRSTHRKESDYGRQISAIVIGK